MPAWLLKIQSSNFIHNEVTGGRKWPELLREKDGTAVPLFCSTWWGHCRAPRFLRKEKISCKWDLNPRLLDVTHKLNLLLPRLNFFW